MTIEKSIKKPIDHQAIARFMQRLAQAMIDAQTALDNNLLETFDQMADKEKGVQLPGSEDKHSLLELGLVPAYFHFTHCHFHVRVSVSTMSSSGPEMKPVISGLPTGLIPGLNLATSPVNAGFAGKYSYPAPDASSVSMTLNAVPTPALLTELLEK